MKPEQELLTPHAEEASAQLDALISPPLDEEDIDPPSRDGDLPSHSDQNSARPFDPSALDDEALMKELERRTHLFQTPNASVNPRSSEASDPRLAQIVELTQTNPHMAEAMRLQLAEERATARILHHIGPTLAPIARREAIQKSGLSEHAQQYLSETFAQMPGVDVAALMHNPLTRDVLTRAARQYENEKVSQSAPRFESASSEAPSLSAEDWRAIRDFERMTGDRVDPEVIDHARKGF
jgi:hypothetical protein